MPSKEQEEQLPANPNKPPPIQGLDHNAPLEKSHTKSDAVGDLKSPTTPQTKVRESRMIEKSRIVLLASLAFVAFLVFVYTTRGKTPDLQNPANWKPHELKEWLAEHRIHYEGIPEKQDLIKLVKENWALVQDKTPGDAAQDFIAKCMMIIKNRYGKAEEIAEDKVENFTQDAAEIIEQLRLNSGLTEEQVAATFDKIMAELTSTKIKTSETINRALEQIHESYHDALKQRDSLLKDAVERIQNDIKSSKEISQETVDWFKEQVKKMSESTGFAKARTQTQVTMILQSIQEQLTAKKITAPQNANVIYERLNSSVKEYYQDIESRLERVRQDLMKSIGDQADFIVDDLKSGFQGYQQLTQERIHEILEQIYAKLKEGKDFTIDQIQEIGNIVNWYFFYPMHSATEEVKKATSKVQDAGQNQFAYITDAIEKTLAKARTVPQEKFQFRETIMQNIFSAQHLTQEQSRILSQIIQDQLKDVNDASELTKEKVVMFVEALKKRLAEYEDVSQKANTKNEL